MTDKHNKATKYNIPVATDIPIVKARYGNYGYAVLAQGGGMSWFQELGRQRPSTELGYPNGFVVEDLSGVADGYITQKENDTINEHLQEARRYVDGVLELLQCAKVPDDHPFAKKLRETSKTLSRKLNRPKRDWGASPF